ncbi:MAG TPA: hypothetical protein VG273_21345 [Bryobacteraceae bacterium]|jgi:hypothetical protein|nr:hypothetical protein [Bryobacteraceae bacterium]
MRTLPQSSQRALATFLLMSASAFPAGELRRVSIHVSNSYGDALSTATIAIKGNRQSLTAVPDQDEQILPVAMEVGRIENNIPDSCSIRGSVLPGTGVTRVRVIQLAGSYSVDVPLKNGAFVFHDLKCGDYMLVAIGTKECLGSRMARAAPIATGSDINLSTSGDGACLSTNQ